MPIIIQICIELIQINVKWNEKQDEDDMDGIK
jgi:hypothetical protein